jgi:hypothetical protein
VIRISDAIEQEDLASVRSETGLTFCILNKEIKADYTVVDDDGCPTTTARKNTIKGK